MIPIAPDEGARSFAVTVAPTGQVFEAARGERLLGAARRAGVWLPFQCGWGSCGTCKVSVLEGSAESVFPDAPSRSEQDRRRNRILLCQSVATSDLTIKPFRVNGTPAADLDTRDDMAELIKVEQLGPDISRFAFRLKEPVPYREGQYAVLEVAPGVRRCYSMEDLAGTDAVSFIAKRYANGAGSNALFGLAPSAIIPLELPYGAMHWRAGARPAVLIAGGTGISPVLAMVRRLVADGDPRPVHVCYGAGSPAELAAWDELNELIAQLPAASLTGVVLTPDPGWTGAAGLVTDGLRGCAALAGDSEVYLAGPPPMVDAVLVLLKELNVGMHRISYDRFG